MPWVQDEGKRGDADAAHPFSAPRPVRGTIQVSEFVPFQANPAPSAYDGRHPDQTAAVDLLGVLRLRYPAATSAAVALGVIALHAAVLIPAWGGARVGRPLPPKLGTATTIQAAIIDDRSAYGVSAPLLTQPALRPIQINMPDTRKRPIGDASVAAVYGRYLGQIHARIDRAWTRPRGAIGAPIFQCEVEVRQRRDGTVAAITLQRCNGTKQWQQSLVQGISAASPLPAPPNPAAFAHRVELHFEAMASAREIPLQR